MRFLVHLFRQGILGPRLGRLATLNEADVQTLLSLAREGWKVDGVFALPAESNGPPAGSTSVASREIDVLRESLSALEVRCAGLVERVEVLERALKVKGV